MQIYVFFQFLIYAQFFCFREVIVAVRLVTSRPVLVAKELKTACDVIPEPYGVTSCQGIGILSYLIHMHRRNCSSVTVFPEKRPPLFRHCCSRHRLFVKREAKMICVFHSSFRSITLVKIAIIHIFANVKSRRRRNFTVHKQLCFAP